MIQTKNPIISHVKANHDNSSPKYAINFPSLSQNFDMPQPNWFFATPSLALLATAEKHRLYQPTAFMSTKCQKKMNFFKKHYFFTKKYKFLQKKYHFFLKKYLFSDLFGYFFIA